MLLSLSLNILGLLLLLHPLHSGALGQGSEIRTVLALLSVLLFFLTPGIGILTLLGSNIGQIWVHSSRFASESIRVFIHSARFRNVPLSLWWIATRIRHHFSVPVVLLVIRKDLSPTPSGIREWLQPRLLPNIVGRGCLIPSIARMRVVALLILILITILFFLLFKILFLKLHVPRLSLINKRMHVLPLKFFFFRNLVFLFFLLLIIVICGSTPLPLYWNLFLFFDGFDWG